MSRIIRDYVDGAVDLKTGAAITPEGVRRFRFPRLAFAAEKTGMILLGAMNRSKGIRPTVYVDPAEGAKIAEDFTTVPQTQRRVGAVALSVALAVAAAANAEPMVDASAAFLDTAAEIVDPDLAEPLSNLFRP